MPPIPPAGPAESHSRQRLESGPPYSVDSALHVLRYAWAVELLARRGDTAIAVGCSTGLTVALSAATCARAFGIDLDPSVVRTNCRHDNGVANWPTRCLAVKGDMTCR